MNSILKECGNCHTNVFDNTLAPCMDKETGQLVEVCPKCLSENPTQFSEVSPGTDTIY